MVKIIRIDLERFKAALCLRGDDVTEPLGILEKLLVLIIFSVLLRIYKI